MRFRLDYIKGLQTSSIKGETLPKLGFAFACMLAHVCGVDRLVICHQSVAVI